MATEPGHRESWSAPAGGWPTFDALGQVVTGDRPTCRTMAHVDTSKVGWCICINRADHASQHRCICGAIWTDESVEPRGKW